MSQPPTKSIAKKQTVKPMAQLAVEDLWKQSIEAGKVKGLIEALQNDPEGRRALEKLAPTRQDVITVIMVGGDGLSDGIWGYVPVEKAPWLAVLLKHYKKTLEVDYSTTDNPGLSRLGGVALDWSEMANALEWVEEVLAGLEDEELGAVLDDALEITITEDDEDQEPREWYNNNAEEVELICEKKFRELFDENNLTGTGGAMLSPDKVHELTNLGCQLRVLGTITINTDNWG